MKLRCIVFGILFLLPIFVSAQEADTTGPPINIGFQSDYGMSVRPPYLNGRTIFKNEGNVIYTHQANGARIFCDSAYHYFPNDTIEFFGNIVIEHEDTRLFGETIFYDGTIARVRGNLVTMQNQERNAVLRTQFVDYNIDENTGIYFNGGTLTRNRDTIESLDGHFDGNTGLFNFINEVAMKNDTMVLACDTMNYDTHNDVTTFLGNVRVWNGENNFMLSDFGWYKPNENLIHFSDNAYIQSTSQEVWSDSMFFDRISNNGTLYNNVQMIDTSQTVIIFGDKAELNNAENSILVTQNPAALYYNIPQNDRERSDTTYLIGDTIHSFIEEYIPKTESENSGESNDDSENEERLRAREALRGNSSSGRVLLSNDEIDASQQKRNTAAMPNINKRMNIGESAPTSGQAEIDALKAIDSVKNTIKSDTTNNPIIDTVTIDSINNSAADTVAVDTTPKIFTRSVVAHKNVKIFKSDFQALCDSLVYHSYDSTTYMFHSPILWNDSTQITSGPSVFYSKNGQFDYAEFSNPAIAAMQEDSVHFSQIKGKKMEAFFSNNQIYKIDVLGNGQSVYYIREKDTLPVSTVEISECANIKINIHKNRITRVAYYMKPTSDTYPIDQVPEDADRLSGFVWHDDIRPKSKNDLFNRIVRPRKRENVKKYIKPNFAITARINEL